MPSLRSFVRAKYYAEYQKRGNCQDSNYPDNCHLCRIFDKCNWRKVSEKDLMRAYRSKSKSVQYDLFASSSDKESSL